MLVVSKMCLRVRRSISLEVLIVGVPDSVVVFGFVHDLLLLLLLITARCCMMKHRNSRERKGKQGERDTRPESTMALLPSPQTGTH